MTLFKPMTLVGLSLRNHIIMAPMTRSRVLHDSAPSELNAEYYRQRAGAGLIITEGTAPSPNGLGYPRIPGLFNNKQINGWQQVTRAIHDQLGRIFVQLMHVGRVAHRANLPEGAEVVAPSAVELPGEMYTDSLGLQPHTPARAMETSDIAQAREEFVQAARNAITAGFDGIELHAANGYLVEQFIHPHTNRRDDEYGRSIENRCRFALEIMEGIAGAIGKERIGIRLSPYGVFNDMPHYPDIKASYRYLAGELDRLGIAYIHLVDHTAMGAPAVPMAIKQTIRRLFSGKLILCGGYDKQRAEQDLRTGLADLIAFGRPFIANPDLVERLRRDKPLTEPDPNTFYTLGEEGYTSYPTL